MRRSIKSLATHSFVLAVVLALAVAGARASEPCQALLERLQAAEAASDIPALTQIHHQAAPTECAVSGGLALRDLAGRVLANARYAALSRNGVEARPVEETIAELRSLSTLGAPWQARQQLADLLQQQHQFAEAAREYQRAIEVLSDPELTPEPPAHKVIAELVRKGQQARLLAPEYIASTRNRAGEPSGFASRAVRGFKIPERPLPVEFETDSAVFTAKGRVAMDDLVSTLQSQRPATIRLIGHTDERGTDKYNDDLSLKRAKAMQEALKARGVTAQIETDGRGKREPLPIQNAETFEYTQEQVWQLNRRVELIMPDADNQKKYP